MTEETYLIAGLGNPGARYENTRHNAGFVLVDSLARSEKEYLSSEKWDAHYCRVSLWGARVFFVAPQSFMNLSGNAISRFVDFFKIETNHLLVIHDDIDMPPGRVKLVSGGGPGGHNGIRSMIQCLGTRDFFRLKYGVGRPGQNNVHSDIPVDRYVLASFTEEEQLLLQKRTKPIIEGIQTFVRSGPQKAMNMLNVIK